MYDVYAEILNAESKVVKNVENKWAEFKGSGRLSLDKINELTSFACRDEGFKAEYEQALKTQFGEKAFNSATKSKGIRAYSNDELESQKAFSKKAKAFADSHTVETGEDAGDIVLGDLMPSNVLPALSSLFYETSSVLNSFNFFDTKQTLEIPEIETVGVAQQGRENETLTERQIGKREAERLDPNKKIGDMIKVSESLLEAPIPGLVAELQASIIFGIQDKTILNIFNGDDTGVNFRGLRVVTGSGATERGAIISDVSGGSHAFDKIQLLWRSKPSKLGAGIRKQDLAFYLNDQTLADIALSMDLNNNYIAMEAIRNGKILMYDGTEVPFYEVDSSVIPNGEVLLGAGKKYYVATSKRLGIRSDQGVSNFASGEVLIKGEFKGDGGYAKSFTKKADGTTSNADQNIWRRATGITGA